jgi:2-keto-4-pentenoate hydratase/2-oxohepta-3-ene-1,7-dioic acid hydratase in catechol pathway
MRLGSLLRNGKPSLGLVCDDKVLMLNEIGGREPSKWHMFADAADITPLFSASRGILIHQLAGELVERGIPEAWEGCCEPLATCQWLSPIAAPEKIICIGLNYRDHAAETQVQIPTEPVVFSKYANALIGASQAVVLPSNSSQVDYEAELAVVIGKDAKRIPADRALEYVAGYTIVNDVSARDWQFRSGQWLQGKTFDTFAPCGPYLVTSEEIADPNQLGISLTLNGQAMQESNTRNMIFDVPELLSRLSQLMTLKPGDIISTGTPSGVGFVRRPQVFLKPGDLVEISVEGIGTLRHSCIAEGR